MKNIDKWSLLEDRTIRFGCYESLCRISRQMMGVPDGLFPDLAWNDEPVEAEII